MGTGISEAEFVINYLGEVKEILYGGLYFKLQKLLQLKFCNI